MKIYESTRNKEITASASQAVLQGLAPDGGLFVMRELDTLSVDLGKVMAMSYFDMAKSILGMLLPDYDTSVMSACVDAAYSGKFDCGSEITPLVKVGNKWVLELFHGPTSAFKDVALQMLPQLVTAAKKMNNDPTETVILTATSGDTGKAALEGFRDVDGTKIIVFFPEHGVSTVQKAQMTTQEGNNTYVCGIEGDFDDAQTGVKKIFSNVDIKNKLADMNKQFSSANSINIGRLAPQVIYYFSAYKQLLANGAIKMGDKVNFVVPTGNFGDILAGRYAKMLGLPVGKLICASNSNNVLFDFISTGVYDRKRELSKTISPSMDILVSSNLERLLYYVSGKDNELIAKLMHDLSITGKYEVPESMFSAIKDEFACGWADDVMTKETLKKYYESTGYVADTHTGVGLCVADEYMNKENDSTPTVVLATASPFKFSHSVYSALFGEAEANMYESEYDIMAALSEKTGVPAPAPLAGLRTKPVLHRNVYEKNEMAEFVFNCLK